MERIILCTQSENSKFVRPPQIHDIQLPYRKIDQKKLLLFFL